MVGAWNVNYTVSFSTVEAIHCIAQLKEIVQKLISMQMISILNSVAKGLLYRHLLAFDESLRTSFLSVSIQ